MRAEAWSLVVGYAKILIFPLSCCFFITLNVPNRYEVRDFQPKSREIGRDGAFVAASDCWRGSTWRSDRQRDSSAYAAGRQLP